MLIHFLAIWYVSWPFGMFHGHLEYILWLFGKCFTVLLGILYQENLATLFPSLSYVICNSIPVAETTSGLPDFVGNTYQNGGKIPNNQQIYKMAINYTNCPSNRPNGHTIYQPLPLQAPKKLPKLGIFVSSGTRGRLL
jgi:hypothetical protein